MTETSFVLRASTSGLASACLIFGLCSAAAFGQSEPPPGETPPSPSPAGQQGSGASRDAAAAILSQAKKAETSEKKYKGSKLQVEPPDGEWLIDEEGFRYYVETLPKHGQEGIHWKWLEEGQKKVRVQHGAEYDIADHDDENFYIKVYEIPEPQEIPPPPAPPSAEERAAVAAKYGSGLESSDRLSFAPFDNGLPGRGQWRNGFDVGDMNGDGHIDIVFGPYRKGPLVPNIFLGDSRGNWRLWTEVSYPEFPYDYGDAEVEDFDGDGHQDLALGMHLTGMVVLRGDGAGSFTAWTEGISLATFKAQRSGPGSFSSRDIVAHDWNRDGKVDLVALGEGMARVRIRGSKTFQRVSPDSAFGVMVYLNQGDGTWLSERLSQEGFGDSLAIGDWNGDGQTDVVSAVGRRGSSRLLNLAAEDGSRAITAIESLPPRSSVISVAGADLDADGVDDFLIGYANRDVDMVWRTGVDIYYGNRDGAPRRRPLHVTETRGGIFSLATGDLDGDGRLDVAAYTSDGEARIFLGEDGGFFTHEASPELPAPRAGCGAYALGLVDLDGDGRDEMVVGKAGEPTGLVGLTGEPGCPGEGSLRVFRVADAGGGGAAP